MIYKTLATCAFLLTALTTSVYAADKPATTAATTATNTPLYKIDVKDTHHVNDFSILNPMGNMIDVTMKKSPVNTVDQKDCDYNLAALNNIPLKALIYPVAVEGNQVKLYILYDNQEVNVSKEAEAYAATQGGATPDRCDVTNSVLTVKNSINWSGYVTLGETMKLPLSDKNSIEVTITKVEDKR